MNTERPFLSLRHVEKIYPNGEKAVYDFNLDINKKEFIVIVGPSGCGKSTTLRMIAGLEDITSGDIFLEDELLNYKPSKDRKMAIVFQSYALYPQMNVFDNIAFPLTINKYPTPVVDKKLYPAAEAKRILSGYDFSTVADMLSAAFAVKLKKNERAEKLATVFASSPEAARILIDLYAPLDAAAKEKGLNRKEEAKENENEKTGILASWNESLDAVIEEGKKRLDEAGEKYNDRFEMLDDNGEVRIESRMLTPYEIRKKVYETAEILDLRPYLDKLPKELSGGQMQRVALGRAIVKNVPIFMMDEPLSNLDAKLRLTMRSEIVKLHNKIGATTIYVTHDQTEAMTMATRIVVMSRGFVQQIGSPEEVYNDPHNVFVARFIGSPTMNMFDVNYDREKNTIAFGNDEISLGERFVARHDAFYADKEGELVAMQAGFDEKAREKLLKLLSVTGESKVINANKRTRKSIIERIKEKFGKAENEDERYADEKRVLAEKLDEIRGCTSCNHTLIVGIRPERIKVEKKRGKAKNGGFVVKPTVCELLGGEYNVHFDFCGKDMIGRIDAKHKVTIDDELTVAFEPEDLYIFDPITGDVIK